MLQGLEVDENPLLSNTHKDTELEILFEDEWLVVVNKPSGMLSVPGKEEDMDSVYHRLKEKVSGRNRTDDRTPTRYGDFGVTACCQDKRSTSTFTGAI